MKEKNLSIRKNGMAVLLLSILLYVAAVAGCCLASAFLYSAPRG